MGITSAENPAIRPFLITDMNGGILEEGVITLEEESKNATVNIVTASRDHLMVDFTAYIPSEVPGQVKSMHSIMELDFSDKGKQTFFLHGEE